MELLLRLPKKPVLDILTTIEEEIELLAIDDSQLITSKSVLNDTTQKWNFVLSVRYLLAITFFFVLTAVKVYFVVQHVDTTIVIPRIYEPLILLKNLEPTIDRYLWDTFELDPTTYALGRPRVVAELSKTLTIFEENIAKLRERLVNHLPPKLGDDDSIYKIWRKGLCYAGNGVNDTACTSATYRPDIGYTYQLATSGLEFQLYTLVQSARNFIAYEDWNQKTASKTFQLYEVMFPQTFNNFEFLVRQYNDYSSKSTVTATVVLFTLAAGVVVSFGIYYYLGFWSSYTLYTGGNHQLICIVFMVNSADRLKHPDLNTFVESAGASIN